MVVDESKDNVDDFERLINMDTEAPGTFDDGPRRSLTRMEEEADRKHDAMANVVARPESLNDYLMHQIGEMEIEPELAAMAQRIISALDASDGGYLKSSLEDLLPPDAGPAQLELARRALEIVQHLDPPGIAARDLRECLLAQLTPDMPFYEELKTLISSHLEDLRDNRLPLIERKTGYSISGSRRPGSNCGSSIPSRAPSSPKSYVPTVTPDISVEQADDGSYRVVLEDARTPRLYISEYYRQRMLTGKATPEEREFIKQQDQRRPVADRFD